MHNTRTLELAHPNGMCHFFVSTVFFPAVAQEPLKWSSQNLPYEANHLITLLFGSIFGQLPHFLTPGIMTYAE